MTIAHRVQDLLSLNHIYVANIKGGRIGNCIHMNGVVTGNVNAVSFMFWGGW